MAVENRLILEKIRKEWTEANRHQHGAEFIKHVEHMKLLCELLLEAHSEPSTHTEHDSSKQSISPEELKAMLGSSGVAKDGKQKESMLVSSEGEQTEREANGTSIFDF